MMILKRNKGRTKINGPKDKKADYYTRDGIDRLSRKVGGLARFEDCVDESIKRIEGKEE